MFKIAKNRAQDLERHGVRVESYFSYCFPSLENFLAVLRTGL